MKENDLIKAAENFSLDREAIYKNVIGCGKPAVKHKTLKAVLIAAALLLLTVTVCFAASPALKQYLNLPFLKGDSPARRITLSEQKVITTPEELDAVRNDLTGFYILGNDITIPDEYYLEGGLFEHGFTPIGADGGFEGVFDGNGHTIYNLKIDNSNGRFSDCGMFTVTNTNFFGGTVYHLRVADSTVISSRRAASVGVIAGKGTVICGCSVENCTVTVTDGGDNDCRVGLIAGDCFLLDSCFASGTVICPESELVFAGGLAGKVGSAVTSLSRAAVTVGDRNADTLVGISESMPVVIPEKLMDEITERVKEKYGTEDGVMSSQAKRIYDKFQAFYVMKDAEGIAQAENLSEEKKQYMLECLIFTAQCAMTEQYNGEPVYILDPRTSACEDKYLMSLLNDIYGHGDLAKSLYDAGCKYGIMYCYQVKDGAADYPMLDFDEIWDKDENGIPFLGIFEKSR